MTISKKLLIVVSLLLGLQLNIGAYYSSYRAGELKTEITSIFNFMDTLKQENNETAQALVTQLEKEFKNAEEKYEWNRYNLEDTDVIDMARIISKNETLDAKITGISAILSLKEAAKEIAIKKDTERAFKAKMECLAAIAGFIGCFATLLAVERYFIIPNRIITNTPTTGK